MSTSEAGTHKPPFVAMMLKAATAMLLLPFGLCAPAVMGTLRGRIIDGSGVAAAKVFIAVISAQGRVKFGVSNAKGQYAIHDLDPGVYTLWAQQENPSILESAHLGIRRGRAELVNIKLSLSRQRPQFAPTSRNSRMDLAGLEIGNSVRCPDQRDVCRNRLAGIS
jgi:Carboxypeptidase regulatory-like domain